MKLIKDLFSPDQFNQEDIKEIKKVIEIEQRNNGEDLTHKTGNTKNDKINDFQKCKTMQSYGKDISNGTTTLDSTSDDQVNIKNATDNFNKSATLRILKKNYQKILLLMV